VSPEVAVDLFCLDLFKEFDVDQLVAIAQPVQVKQAFAQSPK